MINVHPHSSALLTDLYQLTMLQGYYEQGMEQTAVFEFFVRSLPRQRNFLLAAGLEQLLVFLEELHLTQDDLDWLDNTHRFRKDFVDYLAALRFGGDVDAAPEGTVFFPDEPIVRVVAPLPQAQLVESRLINLIHFQTLIASKAVRCALAAPDKLLVDFGLRRAHGAEAGLLAARASYLAGLSGTATVLAGTLYDIPVFGTMAHSFIEAHDNEVDAFEHFARAQPNNVVLLIDTYDTEAAAEKVVALAGRLRENGIRVKGVRIDSGDLAEHARRVRRILDAGGLRDTTIFASGNLDEYALQSLAKQNAPIDGFGIGTRLDTSADAPYLDCAYKLQEYAGQPRRKKSEGKATWPGRKQVYRYLDDAGHLHHDVLTTVDDIRDGEALLQPVMRSGRRVVATEPLARLRERTAAELQRLAVPFTRLEQAPAYTVEVSQRLRDVTRAFDRHAGAGG